MEISKIDDREVAYDICFNKVGDYVVCKFDNNPSTTLTATQTSISDDLSQDEQAQYNEDLEIIRQRITACVEKLLDDTFRYGFLD